MTELVNFEFIYVPNPDGKGPVPFAQLYFGVEGGNPKEVGDQIPVYAIQEDDTRVEMSQPVLTNSGGVPTYNGNPVRLVVDITPYSLHVDDAQGNQVYYSFGSSGGDAEELVTEVETLADGQIIVNFSTVTTDGAVFYVGGTSVDRGRLAENIDYNITGTNAITLENSFPSGSIITALQIQIDDVEQTVVDYFNIINATTPYLLGEGDSGSFIVFDDAADAVIDVPDSLTEGHSILTANKGGGLVSFNLTGTDTLRGVAAIADATSMMTLAKLAPTVYQSSER